MTTEPVSAGMGRGMAWFLGIAGALLLVGGLAWLMIVRTQPPGIDEERAAERRRHLAELRAADQQALNSAGVVDAGKGLYRLPMREAKNLMLVLWQDAAEGRADLLRRVAAAAPPPPPPPAPPPVNIYE